MIAVDTSAIIAVVQLEPEAVQFTRCMEEADSGCLSAVSLQEALMVLAGRRGDTAVWALLDQMIRDLELEIVSHDAALARIASDAFLRFGKGRHPARLNCGDCASYALAKSRDIPLLFKGDDFAKTDIIPALAAPA
ncbi:MAG TPA: type II toxin-antitoxin system VapC family toxin [Acetobacteraceae bacterium]|nr:type II toxin-antitoxin system VapC family toxin [Acetobacteraceae bacterium]